MSEFSKLTARLDCVLVELSSIDSTYADYVGHSTETGHVAPLLVISTARESSNSEAASSSHASQLTNTLTSGTPGIRNQYAWRSNNSGANTDKDEFASAAGVEALSNYDSVVRIQEEIRTKLSPSCEQFLLKSKTKDSITDLPRYGTAMIAKIVAACEKSSSCLDLCTILVDKLGHIVQNENALKQKRKSEAEIVALKKEQDELLLASINADMVGFDIRISSTIYVPAGC